MYKRQHQGLAIREEEDGSVSLYDLQSSEEPVYTFAVPYLYDANDQYSAGIRYQVMPGKEAGKSILSFSLDQEWLQANERAYPVVIDPVTITSKQSVDIEDTFRCV